MKNRIRELRAEKNITQLRLSLELEVSQETVSAYENGKHLPSLKSLIKMADIFHVSTDYLIGRSDVRGSSAIIRYYCYIPCTSTLLQATACHIFHTLYVLSFLICY